jgi:site-specific DNA recombinase
LFDPEHLDRTCEQLAATSATSATPDDGDLAGMELARRKVADCDRRLGRYRGALDGGADPAVVATWISQVQGEKFAAQKVLAVAPLQSSTPAEIRVLIARLGDLVATLGRADSVAKAELYAALGLRLTYKPNERQVDIIATPRTVDVSACRRGDLNPHPLARTRPST